MGGFFNTMLYPLIEDYKDSFRNPDNYFDKLKPLYSVKATWDTNEIHFISGGFAVVFKLKDDKGKYWAFKCFTQDVTDRQERLKDIATHLQSLKNPYFVDFQYLENELWVCSKLAGDREYPIVMMPWVEGVTLGAYINDICQKNDTQKLYDLLQNCVKMFAFLLDSGIAHGDLKHDNILVKPNGEVILIDYDGMYVPTLWHKKMIELGSPSYQHPNRQNMPFNAQLDHFSMLVILTSIYALYRNPALKSLQNTPDHLLFQQKDFLNPAQSPTFKALASLNDALLNTLCAEIVEVVGNDYFYHIPKLKGFLGEIKKIEKSITTIQKFTPELTMTWWNGLSNEWQEILYAHAELWIEQGILLTNDFIIKLKEKKKINWYDNILGIYNVLMNKSVVINPNNIKNILLKLSEIEILCLYKCKITNLLPLQYLKNLIWLNLFDNQIKDISSLQHLENLIWLNLYDNQIANVSSLQYLKNLDCLLLGGNPLMDISSLQYFTNLKTLSLRNCQIIDISPLQNLTNLTNLDLGKNQIKDALPLQHLANLTELHLFYNQIKDSQIKELQKALPNCKITF